MNRYISINGRDKLDLSERVYGSVTVLRHLGHDSRFHFKWECQCVCGKLFIAREDGLVSGRTHHCGCKKAKMSTKHGLFGTKIYNTYERMRARCYNSTNEKYKHYGARGIIVCDRWLGVNGLVNFVKDMGLPPSKYHSIDRRNVDGNYEPTNCRWATIQQQCENQRRTIILECGAEKATLTEWCRRLKIGYDFLKNKLKIGMTIDEVITKYNIPYLKIDMVDPIIRHAFGVVLV